MSQENTPPNHPQNSPSAKVKKAKGPIRTEAVVPFVIVTLLVILYFHFLFDTHLRKALEYAGYEAVGAEVNIDDIDTSFFNGSFHLKKLQITNAQRPTHNSVEIGEIRFAVLWDGLLRAKVIINEMAVEKIAVGTQRKKAGKVRPPDPDRDTGPGLVDQIKDQTLNRAKKQYDKNVLGDVVAMLQGTSAEDQLKNIENALPSKQKMKEFETVFNQKKTEWDQRIKSLPKGSELKQLEERISKVKVDFKKPNELQAQLKEINAIIKEIDTKVKLVESTGRDLDGDLKAFDRDIKEIDALIRKDIADLEARFKIPKLDAKSFSEAIFRQYMTPYIAKFAQYRQTAEKYMPPNLLKKGQNEPDPQIQPRPRSNGVTYEFGKPHAYPLFWVKRISVSSQAGSTPESGNLKGLITDVTSNQVLTGKPTVARIEGDFPAMDIAGVMTQLTLDNRLADSRIGFDLNVGSYPLAGKTLLSSSDVDIAFEKARGGLKTTAELVALRRFKFDFDNNFREVIYKVEAKNKIVDDILKGVFAGIPVVTAQVTGQGELPASLDLDINSNIGIELQRGFEAQIKRKIDEAKAKIQAFVNDTIGKEKARIESEYAKIKSQAEGEIKKVKDQIENQKKVAEAKTKQSTKDTEDQLKKKLGDELKKRFRL